MEEMIGATVGSYTIVRFIGEGGMGTVWLGKHATIDRQVAIKMLHPQYGRNEKIRERFRREATTLARLQHPNIVTLYDYLEVGQHLCLVMEYVEGQDLDILVREKTGPLPTDRLAAIFRQILSAISYAHQQGVVHRDIKPSNFMLTADDKVKVLDFGIAKLLDDGQQLTRTGMRMGTTAYMSPEQVQGLSVDHRSDIYALGVTLFFLATGQSPYNNGMSEFQVYSKIVQEPLPPARTVYPGVSELIERVIQVATAKRVEDRFQSVDGFLMNRSPQNEVKSDGKMASDSRQDSTSGDRKDGESQVRRAPATPEEIYSGKVKALCIVALLQQFPIPFLVIPPAIAMLYRKRWSLYVMRGLTMASIVLCLFLIGMGISLIAETGESGYAGMLVFGLLFGTLNFWCHWIVFDPQAKSYFNK